MRVLVACEWSGVVREAFAKRGHDAWSCDFEATEQPTYKHIIGDVMEMLNFGWDLMIAHPPCTYLAVSAAKYLSPQFMHLYPNRKLQQLEAVDFFLDLAFSKVPKVCIENPVGIISTAWRPPNQYIQPYEFGEPFSKKTGLWLKNLPLLRATNVVKPLVVTTKSGRQWGKWFYDTSLLPLDIRGKVRGKTFQGIADAMAKQWG